jgi:uncharacterized membrane protein YfcA
VPSALLLATATAFAAGVVDAIAGGGGLLTLPALLALGLPPHVALGTNKGQAVFGAASSFLTFWYKKQIDTDRAAIGFTLAFVGSAGGAALVLAVRPEPLRPLVIALLLFAAVVVFARGYVHAEPRRLEHPLFAAGLVALALGVYDGFFGPGVGSLLIVAFTLVFGDTLTRASGNAKINNLASNVAALGLFAWRGAVLWEIALPMALANALGAAAGARLAVRRGDRLVRVVVLIVVSALVVKLGVDWARP